MQGEAFLPGLPAFVGKALDREFFA